MIIASGACGTTSEAPADAPQVDAPIDVYCPTGEAVTVAGTTPLGGLDGLAYRHLTTTSGFCNALTLHYSARPTLDNSQPRPRLEAIVDASDVAAQQPLPPGSARSTIVRFIDETGAEVRTMGSFVADELGFPTRGSRTLGRLVVDDPAGGWSLDLAVDARSCYHTACF